MAGLWDSESERGRRPGSIAAVALVVVACLIGVGVFALVNSDKKTTGSITSTSTTRGSAAVHGGRTPDPTAGPETVPTSPSPATESAVLPLVACPTTYGVSPTSTDEIPSTVAESVPTDLAGRLAVYTDGQGSMKVLGPTGWSCAANYGADGSGGVQVYPSGQSDPNDVRGPAGSAQGIIGTQNGGCAGCALTQASPLFSAAADRCEAEFSGASQACPLRPAGESTEPIESGVVGFLDPPGVKGDGVPSGGQYPANGVMTFHTENPTSYLETCTLPDSQHALCTAVLDNFVHLYGDDP